MSYYYDTCIFLTATNEETRDYRECARLVDFPGIGWTIWTCPEAVLVDAPIEELLVEFETNCIRNGIDFRKVALTSARTAGRDRYTLKERLRKMGFGGNDWHHLCAAIVADVIGLVSCDEDFFDPKNKAMRSGKKKGDVVRRTIEAATSLKILRPKLCPCG